MNYSLDDITWQEAITIVQKVFRHEPFTKKCSDDNPNTKQRDTFRRYVVKLVRSINYNDRTTLINIERLEALRIEEQKAVIVSTQISIQPGHIAPEFPTSQNPGFQPTSPYLQYESTREPEIKELRTYQLQIESGTPIATPVPPEFVRPARGPTSIPSGIPVNLQTPGMVQQAANLVGAVARAGGAFLTGQQVLCTEDELKARQAICDNCEHWQIDPRVNMHRCRACGCYQLKQYVKTEKCPLKKWPGDQ
jgi:hypothetical protein